MCSGTHVGVHPDPRVNTQRASRLSTPPSDVQLFFLSSSHAIRRYSLSFSRSAPGAFNYTADLFPLSHTAVSDLTLWLLYGSTYDNTPAEEGGGVTEGNE